MIQNELCQSCWRPYADERGYCDASCIEKGKAFDDEQNEPSNYEDFDDLFYTPDNIYGCDEL